MVSPEALTSWSMKAEKSIAVTRKRCRSLTAARAEPIHFGRQGCRMFGQEVWPYFHVSANPLAFQAFL
jgi:hypothetical protein